MATALPYEVQAIDVTGKPRTVRVHAYNAMDAMTQAFIQLQGEAHPGELTEAVKILSVGPPAESCYIEEVELMTRALELKGGVKHKGK